MFKRTKAKRIAIICAPLIALALGTGCSKTQEATPAALVMENVQGSPKASAPVFITIASNSCQVAFDFCDGERIRGIRGLNNAVYYGCGVDGCPADNVSTYGLGGELFCMQEGTTYYVLPQACICSTMPSPPQYGHVLHITFPDGYDECSAHALKIGYDACSGLWNWDMTNTYGVDLSQSHDPYEPTVEADVLPCEWQYTP